MKPVVKRYLTKKGFCLRFPMVLRGNEPTTPPAGLWHLISGGARNEQPQRSSAKVQLLSLRGVQSAQARNGINGRGPPRGKDAVYAGSDLEPIAPRALGVPPTFEQGGFGWLGKLCFLLKRAVSLFFGLRCNVCCPKRERLIFFTRFKLLSVGI